MKPTAVSPHQTDSSKVYFADIWYPNPSWGCHIAILAVSSNDGMLKWYSYFGQDSTIVTSFWTLNYLLSFGGTRNDLLGALTNEHPSDLNQIMLMYLKNIGIDSITHPSTST